MVSTTKTKLLKLIQASKLQQNRSLYLAHKFRLEILESEGKSIPLDAALQKAVGSTLTKKEVVNLWTEHYGKHSVFEKCTLCTEAKINPIDPHIVSLRNNKYFVCGKCTVPFGFLYMRCKEIMNKTRLQVWLDTNSIRRTSKCFCCGLVDLDMLSSDWQMGHICAKEVGGSMDIHNLKPICSGCNLDMGITDMKEYMSNHKMKYLNLPTDTDHLEILTKIFYI